MGAYLLERFLADGDPVAASAAERAVVALRADPLVRVRWSVRVPAEETLLCLVEADTADTARAAAVRAGLSPDRLVPALDDPEEHP